MSRQNPIFIQMLIALFLGMVLLAFVGCKTQPAPSILPAPSEKDKIEYRTDSIYIDRWHKEYVKGDTFYIHDSIYRDRWQHDSIYIHYIDSIPYPVEVEKIIEVDKSPFLRNSGIALWVILSVLFVAVILGIILKFAK